jgi:hypothetical protein
MLPCGRATLGCNKKGVGAVVHSDAFCVEGKAVVRYAGPGLEDRDAVTSGASIASSSTSISMSKT